MTAAKVYPEIREILPDGMDPAALLAKLKQRVLHTNGQKDALCRGALIKQYFPQQAADTIRLANEALAGQLVLPGTGPGLHFVGNPPDWTFNAVNDHEYTFHLNRMHHWKTMSEAYSLTGDMQYAGKVFQEMNHWLDTVLCPAITDESGAPCPRHFSAPNPWRALEVGIRGYRTWPYVIELLIDTPYFTAAFLEKLLPCIYLHCRVLYEISPLLWPAADHNHYLMENLGLLSFSCLFPELKDSRTFRDHALRELNRCMEAQCTPCGGQIEGCPSYHNGCVFWFAMRTYFSAKYGLAEAPEHIGAYNQKLHKMFIHSLHATRACGGNFPWGDSHTAAKETMSLAAAACYMALEKEEYLAAAAYFYPETVILEDIRDNLWRIRDIRQLRETLDRALANPQKPNLPLLAWQKDLNQVYLRSAWDRDAVSLMTACRTPVQNLHAHMDPGGFDFTAYGLPLISDPGIYTYKDGPDRYRYKSIAAHNCLQVNRQDPWEYRGSWAYGPQKRGAVEAVEHRPGLTCITSCHENYAPALVTRHLALLDNRFLLVIDQVSGLSAGDTVSVHYHLNRTDLICQGRRSIRSLDQGPGIELAAGEEPENVELLEGKISTQTNCQHDSTIVCFHLTPDQQGECCFAVLAVPTPAPAGCFTAVIRQHVQSNGLILEGRVLDQTFCLRLAEGKLTRED